MSGAAWMVIGRGPLMCIRDGGLAKFDLIPFESGGGLCWIRTEWSGARGVLKIV